MYFIETKFNIYGKILYINIYIFIIYKSLNFVNNLDVYEVMDK